MLAIAPDVADPPVGKDVGGEGGGIVPHPAAKIPANRSARMFVSKYLYPTDLAYSKNLIDSKMQLRPLGLIAPIQIPLFAARIAP